jgi:hypothetical protein
MKGGTVSLVAIAKDANGNPIAGKTFSWSSADQTKAIVSTAGVVTGIAPTTSVAITATVDGISGASTVAVTVSPVVDITTPPRTLWTLDTNTVLLSVTYTDQYGTPRPATALTWTSDQGGVASVSGNGLVTGLGAGTVNIRATAPSGETDAVAVTVIQGGLATNLRAYYPFSGTANDASGNGQDGTVYGALLTNDRFGQPNAAYAFAGGSEYIDVGPIDLTGAFTIAVWMRPASLSQGPALVSRYASDNQSGYEFYLCQDFNYPCQGLRLHTSGSRGDPTRLDANYPFQTGQWYHAVATYDGAGTARVYVDGRLVQTATGMASDVASSLRTRIGRTQYFPSGSPGSFDGVLDDVRVYTRALSATEIAFMASQRP